MPQLPVVFSQTVGLREVPVSVAHLIRSNGIAPSEIAAALEAAFWHIVVKTDLDYYRAIEALVEHATVGKIWRFVRKCSGLYSAASWILVEETS